MIYCCMRKIVLLLQADEKSDNVYKTIRKQSQSLASPSQFIKGFDSSLYTSNSSGIDKDEKGTCGFPHFKNSAAQIT